MSKYRYRIIIDDSNQFGISLWIMRLAEWLSKPGHNPKALAEQIGTSEASVRRYASGDRIPVSEVMRRIYQVTGGAVTANDFYGLEADGARCGSDADSGVGV